MNSGVKRKTLSFLIIANGLLIFAGWTMAVYSYPRLPQIIPLWVSFFGQQSMYINKSILFFIYPLVQTLFYILFWRLSRINFSKNKLFQKVTGNLRERQLSLYFRLKREFVYLILIFFNLIFIHLQRSIILLAHRIEKGINEFYFYSLFGIILLLIPYYRIRVKLLFRREGLEQ